MGCDIHSHAERKNASGAFETIADLAPFAWRSYGMFGFLAGVRNYSDVPPIAEQRGFPPDASQPVAAHYEEWEGNAHGASWLTLDELLAFDYDAPCEDRRVTRRVGPNHWNGGCTANPGEGLATTFRQFLGEGFFDELRKLQVAGAERVVFWFDN